MTEANKIELAPEIRTLIDVLAKLAAEAHLSQNYAVSEEHKANPIQLLYQHHAA